MIIKGIVEISENDLETARGMLKNGMWLDPSSMDFLDLYACLCMAWATGTEDRIFFSSELRPEHLRDISSELPCRYSFGEICEFTLL